MKLKKLLGIIFIIFMSMIPFIGNAKELKKINLDEYETLNLKETLASEEIEENFKNYSEKDDQITIYMFRGQTCGFCKKFLTFLNGITDEYGKYFKLVSFETWYNNNNSELLKTISNFAENPAQGVPYIIIGENVFPGYASEYDESIKNAIVELYNSDNRYDIFEAYNDSLKSEDGSVSSTTVIICNLIFTAIATIIIIIVIRSSFKNNKNNVNDVKTEEKVISEKISEEKPKEIKKVTNKKKNVKTNNKKSIN